MRLQASLREVSREVSGPLRRGSGTGASVRDALARFSSLPGSSGAMWFQSKQKSVPAEVVQDSPHRCGRSVGFGFFITFMSLLYELLTPHVRRLWVQG